MRLSHSLPPPPHSSIYTRVDSKASTPFLLLFYKGGSFQNRKNWAGTGITSSQIHPSVFFSSTFRVSGGYVMCCGGGGLFLCRFFWLEICVLWYVVGGGREGV